MPDTSSSSLPTVTSPSESTTSEAVSLPFRSGFVALVGRPNVGKSAILNKVVGQKIAISTHVPQTTRHRIRGVVTTRKSQVIFLDTPGFSKPIDHLGNYLVEEGQAALKEADMLVAVMDGSLPPGKGDAWVLTQVMASGKPWMLFVNKLDLFQALGEDQAKHTKSQRGRKNGGTQQARQVHPLKQALRTMLTPYQTLLSTVQTEMPDANPELFKGVIGGSAHEGVGIQAMLDVVRRDLPEGPSYFEVDDVTDQRLREMTAELIREQLLILLYDELPHSVAVTIDHFDESNPSCIRISATLYVNAKSQKGMVIGKGASMIKAIGTQARETIQELLETQVFLNLEVKVKENWRKDEKFLSAINLATDKT
jgi:GTP-binding protein Era